MGPFWTFFLNRSLFPPTLPPTHSAGPSEAISLRDDFRVQQKRPRAVQHAYRPLSPDLSITAAPGPCGGASCSSRAQESHRASPYPYPQKPLGPATKPSHRGGTDTPSTGAGPATTNQAQPHRRTLALPAAVSDRFGVF